MNTHRPDDDALPGEDELGALYRKLPRKEPGPALDAAVLRAAAQAVRGAQPLAASLRPARRPRWPIALGSAAVLLLAAGLGWRMRDMPASVPVAQPGAVTVPDAATPAAAPALPEQAQNYQANAAPAAAQLAPGRSVEASRRQADTAMAKRAAPQAPMASPVPMQEPAMNVPAPVPAAPAEASAADQAAPAAEALRAIAPRRVERIVEQRAGEQQAAEQPAAGQPATAGQAVESAPGIQASPGIMAKPAPPPPPATDTARDPRDTPAQELDKIRRLLAGDRRDEARQRLADFHRERPDYPLPDDLRTQLLRP